MAKAIYDVQVPNIGEVERALGDMRDKAPRAMKKRCQPDCDESQKHDDPASAASVCCQFCWPSSPECAESSQQGDNAEPDGGDFYFQPEK